MLNDLKNMVYKRWPEMLLIVGFLAIGMFLVEQLNAEVVSIQQSGANGEFIEGTGSMSQTTSFLYSMAGMIFVVLWLTMLLGFLATLSINYTTALDPTVLIKIGRRFFWRVIRFQLLFGLFYFAASMLIFSVVKSIFFQSVSIEQISPWVFHICSIVVIGILVKPILLIPPIMICKNCMVMQAMAAMSKYKISDVKILPVVFIGGLVITAATSAMHMDMRSDTVLFNVIVAGKSILTGVLSLATGVIGIWFVGGNKFGVLEELVEREGDGEQRAADDYSN